MIKVQRVNPFGDVTVVAPESLSTPVVYYGGKSRDCGWIISHFPPHEVYLELFGGGGAVWIAKPPSPKNEVYNDFGNVAVWWKILQRWPDELYEALHRTPYSREEFERCSEGWEHYAKKSAQTNEKEDYIEFARMWLVQVNISFSHSENDKSFKPSGQVNNSAAWTNHVDSLPFVWDRIRHSVIEHRHFADVLKQYDGANVLVYADPPYEFSSRVSVGTYRKELGEEDQKLLLKMLCECKADVVLSGYDNDLYKEYLQGWRVVKKTAKSAIQNRKQLDGRGTREEVLWIKEKNHGLWTGQPDQPFGSSASLAEVSYQGLTEAQSLSLQKLRLRGPKRSGK